MRNIYVAVQKTLRVSNKKIKSSFGVLLTSTPKKEPATEKDVSTNTEHKRIATFVSVFRISLQRFNANFL